MRGDERIVSLVYPLQTLPWGLPSPMAMFCLKSGHSHSSILSAFCRFNIFHLMSTGNEHDDRVNIGAKLLSGEEYGGHAFWDTELFMLPFFSYVFPHTAKNLETYRYRMLEAAKANAAKNGSDSKTLISKQIAGIFKILSFTSNKFLLSFSL